MVNGKYLICRGCGSEDHFIRFCPKVKKSSLVAIVFETLPSDYNFTNADVFDIAQELPDDAWLQIADDVLLVTTSREEQTHLSKSSEFDSVMYAQLATWADQHELLGESQTTEIKKLEADVMVGMRNGTNNFEGVMLDNGAAKSPSGLHQDVPLIFGLEHHMKNKCSSNEYEKTFTHHPTDTTIPVTFHERKKGAGGHLYIKWEYPTVLYTEPELRKLHKQFGHPSAKALINLLKRATPEKLTAEIRNVIENISERCTP
eukprot:IDg22358t1